MSDRHRPAYRLPLVASALAAVVAVGVAGCGNQNPGVQVPGLDTTLTSIDHALSAKDTGRARQLLNELISQTRRATQQGRLNQAEHDRILAAAARLLARLPGQDQTTPSATPSETPSPPPSNSTPQDGDQQSQGQGNGGDGGSQSGGHGHDRGNGHGDGHGD